KFSEKREHIARETERLKSTWVQPETEAGKQADKYLERPLAREYNLLDLLKRPEIKYTHIAKIKPGPEPVSEDVAEQIEIQTKYDGYISRQQDEIDKLK